MPAMPLAAAINAGAHINNFPHEVLAIIFRFVAGHAADRRVVALVLQAVCRDWQCVVQRFVEPLNVLIADPGVTVTSMRRMSARVRRLFVPRNDDAIFAPVGVPYCKQNQHTTLEHVDLRDVREPEKMVEPLGFVDRLPHGKLTRLALPKGDVCGLDGPCRAQRLKRTLQKLTALTHLETSGQSTFMVPHLISALVSTNIAHLDLAECPLREEHVVAIATMSKIKSLRMVDCYWLASKALQALNGRLPHLASLDVGKWAHSFVAEDVCAALAGRTNLKWLAIHSPPEGAGLVHMVHALAVGGGGSTPNLTHFALYGRDTKSCPNDVYLKHVAALHDLDTFICVDDSRQTLSVRSKALEHLHGHQTIRRIKIEVQESFYCMQPPGTHEARAALCDKMAASLLLNCPSLVHVEIPMVKGRLFYQACAARRCATACADRGFDAAKFFDQSQIFHWLVPKTGDAHHLTVLTLLVDDAHAPPADALVRLARAAPRLRILNFNAHNVDVGGLGVLGRCPMLEYVFLARVRLTTDGQDPYGQLVRALPCLRRASVSQRGAERSNPADFFTGATHPLIAESTDPICGKDGEGMKPFLYDVGCGDAYPRGTQIISTHRGHGIRFKNKECPDECGWKSTFQELACLCTCFDHPPYGSRRSAF